MLLLQNFSFQQVMLDICEENIASTNVAKNVVFLNLMTEQDTRIYILCSQ